MKIEIGPELVLQIEEPMAEVGIYITVNVDSAPAVEDIISKIYFKVDNGPPLWGHPGRLNYPTDMEDIEKADTHIAWRMAQHERRLWQAGFPPFIGVDHPDYKYEIALTEEQSTEISKHFL